MQAHVTHRDDITVVAFDGALDAAAARDVRDLFDDLLDQGHLRLVIDLQAVEFIDSAGLGALVGLLKRIRLSEGVLRLAGIPSALSSLFELTRLDQIFSTFETAEAAIAG